MKIIEKSDDIISSKKFLSIITKLYGKTDNSQRKRFVDLYDQHCKYFSKNVIFFSSPGRIEVIGNHTDHNNGKVLAASISVDTLACVTPTNDNLICIASCGYPLFKVDLNKIDFNETEQGTSFALVKGVAKYFVDNGLKVGGFKATMTSSVFKGAGVSSSASFEVLIAEVFNIIYNDNKVSKMQKAIASQFAENKYFGKPCGLMDQSAIALGGISMIDFKNACNPTVKTFVWPFDDVDIFIVNTGGDHSDLTDNYAAICFEMEAVAKCFNQKTLRNVIEKDFYKMLPELQNKVSGRAILRAIHYFEENARIDEAVKCILAKDKNGFMDVVKRSGESSYMLLQNCYAESDKIQRIPFALQLSKKQKGVLATRVHGGGFMGTILTFVKKDSSNSYFDNMKSVFGKENIFKLTIRDSGATIVEL